MAFSLPLHATHLKFEKTVEKILKKFGITSSAFIAICRDIDKAINLHSAVYGWFLNLRKWKKGELSGFSTLSNDSND